jgi:thioredoxin 1
MNTHNDTDIQQILDEHPRVVVMFGATWCGPCKTFKPKFQAISKENADIVFTYCDVEETSELAADLEIQSVPTVVGFFNGIEEASVVGPTVDRVKELVENLRTRVKGT